MRVASCVVLFALTVIVSSAGAAPVVDRSLSYPISAAARNAIAAQDAIKDAVQAHADVNRILPQDLANGRTVAGDAFDRRLASLDPTQIVYERSQPATSQAAFLDLNNGKLFPRQEPRQAPRPAQARSTEDFLLMGFAALMLVAYQLRKKHRFLRPHPFSY